MFEHKINVDSGYINYRIFFGSDKKAKTGYSLVGVFSICRNAASLLARKIRRSQTCSCLSVLFRPPSFWCSVLSFYFSENFVSNDFKIL